MIRFLTGLTARAIHAIYANRYYHVGEPAAVVQQGRRKHRDGNGAGMQKLARGRSAQA